jgi:hypothetical protein
MSAPSSARSKACVECQQAAIVHCDDCEQDLCRKCSRDIHKYKIMATHRILPVQVAAAPPSPDCSSSSRLKRDNTGPSESSAQSQPTLARRKKVTFQKQWVATLPLLLQIAGGFFAVLISLLADDGTVLVVSHVVVAALSWGIAGLAGTCIYACHLHQMFSKLLSHLEGCHPLRCIS